MTEEQLKTVCNLTEEQILKIKTIDEEYEKEYTFYIEDFEPHIW